MKIKVMMMVVVVVVFGGFLVVVYVQCDLVYVVVCVGGEVGEQFDGYLGLVGVVSVDFCVLVNNINIQCKLVYIVKVQVSGVIVEQLVFISGCNLIVQINLGEKYKMLNGVWKMWLGVVLECDLWCV